MKLTKWYPAHIKPARVGVYQQMSFDNTNLGYQYWDGRKWGGFCRTIDGAIRLKNLHALTTEWRGLAEKP